MRELVWTAFTFGCCMLFDMLAMKRTGLAWIVPEGAPPIESRVWTGWSVRHLILIPLSFCLQYVIRRHRPVADVVGYRVHGNLLRLVLFDLFRQIPPETLSCTETSSADHSWITAAKAMESPGQYASATAPCRRLMASRSRFTRTRCLVMAVHSASVDYPGIGFACWDLIAAIRGAERKGASIY